MSSFTCSVSLLGREPERAVEADDLAVEIVVVCDVLDERGVLGGPAHAFGVRDLRAPVGLQPVARRAPRGGGGARAIRLKTGGEYHLEGGRNPARAGGGPFFAGGPPATRRSA